MRRLRPFISVMTLGVAAAIAAAPAAGAASDCRQSGASTVCEKPGHASLYAEPQVRASNGSLFGSAWLPGYGRGQLPPLLALD